MSSNSRKCMINVFFLISFCPLRSDHQQTTKETFSRETELFCRWERQIQDIIIFVTITNLFWIPKTKHWGYIEKKIYLEKHRQCLCVCVCVCVFLLVTLAWRSLAILILKLLWWLYLHDSYKVFQRVCGQVCA